MNNEATFSKNADKLSQKTSKQLLKDKIKHLRDIRSGKKAMGMPNPNDVPEEMRPYMSEMEEIGRILGPITSTKPRKPTKAPPPPPKKEYTINHQTVYQQWNKNLDTSSSFANPSLASDEPNKMISFNMSKIILPSILQKSS